MASVAGSKGGISNELKKKLMLLRKKNIRESERQRLSQDAQQVKRDKEDHCNVK